MDRREAIKNALGLAAASALLPHAHAQTPKRIPHIAYVWTFGIGPAAPFVEPFIARMAELGWVEGKTIHITYHDAKGDIARTESIMRELVAQKVDILVVPCTPEAVTAKKVTSTVPVIVAATGDAVKSGLIESWARPGRNITGLSTTLYELSAKRAEIIKQVSPKVSKAMILWNPVRGDNADEAAVVVAGAKSLGYEMKSQQVRDKEELEVTLDAMAREGVQALTTLGDPSIYTHADALVAFSQKTRTVAVYDNRFFVDAGGLMSYGVNLPEMHRRAADFTDKVLKGARPADIPFEIPSRFELVINLKTAKAQGVTVPLALLARADEVIR